MAVDLSRYLSLFVSEATDHLEALSRNVQRTVCGLSPPAFSLIDVATTITVSVRDAEADSSGCCWGGFGPRAGTSPHRARWPPG